MADFERTRDRIIGGNLTYAERRDALNLLQIAGAQYMCAFLLIFTEQCKGALITCCDKGDELETTIVKSQTLKGC